MIAYRISNSQYSNDISGTGAKINGARWNSAGLPMLYTAGHISLAILEMLVNTNFKDYQIPLDLMYIEIPEEHGFAEIKLNKLKKDWKADFEFTRFMGDEFIKQKTSLFLKVPSAVVNEEFNYLVNPTHPDSKKVKIIKTKIFWPDQRLFSI